MNKLNIHEQIINMQKCYGISRATLTRYFQMIYRSLESSNYLNLNTFSVYMNLPLIITKRLFCNEFITRSNFVEIMLQFYFGNVDILISNFYFLFANYDDSDQPSLNLDDLSLTVKHITNDPLILSEYEKLIQRLEKKCNSMVTLEKLKNYIFYEDTNILTKFYKIIFDKQPFTLNAIQYFKENTEKVESEDESSSLAESSEFTSKFKASTEEYKAFEYYILSNNYFTKCKGVQLDNNLFFFRKVNKVYVLYSAANINSFFYSHYEAQYSTRLLFCASMTPKMSISKEKDILFFKDKKLLEFFLKIVGNPTISREFFKKHMTVRILSRSKYSKVFQVRNTETGRQYAVKFLQKNKLEFYEKIKNEVEISNFIMKNPHDNVIKIYDIFEDEEAFYIMMEYIPMKLSSLVNLTKFIKTSLKFKIAKNIAEGLSFLHSNRIVHRDLKPDNIMVIYNMNEECQIKIIDFGNSKILCSREKVKDSLENFVFASPEVLTNKYHGGKVDIWSLGIVVFLLYYNHLPFNGKELNIPKIAEKISNDTTIMNSLKCSKERIDQLISGCLRKDPVNRLSIESVIEIINS